MQINAEWAGETVAWLDRHKIATRPLLEQLRIDRRDLKYGRQIPVGAFRRHARLRRGADP